MDTFITLLNAISNNTQYTTYIQNNRVTIIPLDNSIMLFINDTLSNNCKSSTMRKLIQEWQSGKRKICHHNNYSFLIKNY